MTRLETIGHLIETRQVNTSPDSERLGVWDNSFQIEISPIECSKVDGTLAVFIDQLGIGYGMFTSQIESLILNDDVFKVSGKHGSCLIINRTDFQKAMKYLPEVEETEETDEGEQEE